MKVSEKKFLHIAMTFISLDRSLLVDQGTVVRTDLVIAVSKIFNLWSENSYQNLYQNKAICEDSDFPEVASFATNGLSESWRHWPD